MPDDATLFLEIDGIKGPSTRVTNAIEILTFGWNENLQGVKPEKDKIEASSVEMAPICLTSELSNVSPNLMLACAEPNKNPIKKATLKCMKAAGSTEPCLILTLSPAIISGYSIGCGAGGHPVETFTLSFGKIEMEYKDGKGSVKKWYSLFERKGG